LYIFPGTRITLLARVIASNIDAKFLKIVGTSIKQKNIGVALELSYRCSVKQKSINHALFSFMKSTQLEEKEYHMVLLQIEKFTEL